MTAAASALTTVYTSPTICNEFYWGYGVGTGSRTALQKHFTAVTSAVDTCFAHDFYDNYGTYSPGMCPDGFTTAVTSIIDGTTSAQCCPIGYIGLGERGDYVISCYSYFTTPFSASAIDDGRYATVLPSGTLDIFAYWVAYQAHDISHFPAGYTPGTVAAIQTSNSSAETGVSPPTGSTSANPGAENSQEDKGMSIGAKVGLGVGIGLGVLISVGAGVWLMFYKRKHRKNGLHKNTESSIDRQPYIGGKAELHADDVQTKPIYDLSEMDGSHQPTVQRYEVDGNPVSQYPRYADRAELVGDQGWRSSK